jgi:hypothetical protein
MEDRRSPSGCKGVNPERAEKRSEAQLDPKPSPKTAWMLLELGVMAREISLSGGDISVLKAIGMSGTAMYGHTLIDRLKDMEEAEMIDALEGLMMFDYIICDLGRLKTIEDVERATFKVNPACAKELRDALSPQRKEAAAKPRRQRRG